ncbi:MAG TPA: hypothetical protein VFQ35_27425 [Polyangiaceae bacterium]|nr:hypothetical protein [Polyangiaceae bacterium]
MRDLSTGALNPLLALGSCDAVLGEIERVTKIKTPVIRNLWITQHYHSLMHALAVVLGGSNANWSTFATWASKTAGQSIRGEEIPKEMQWLLGEQAKVHERLVEALKLLPGAWAEQFDVFAVPKAVLDNVSRQIAIGNLEVFAELAPLFAKFWDRFSEPSRRVETELDAFVSTLKDGPVDQGGQDWLKTAFTSYFAASRAKTLKEAAEFILYGNLLIGLHEQTRLQPYIAGALDAPFEESSYEALLAAEPDWIERVVRPIFRQVLKLFRKEFEDDWERLATRYLMTLTLPGGQVLNLSQDVPIGTRPFPQVLNPLEYAELKRLVSTYDPNLDSLKGSGARNWTEIGNRMAFISDLFRSRQQDTSLFEQPFTKEQLAALIEGKVPPGPL